MGYPNPVESDYDLFVTGHAGSSVSTVLGMKAADDLLDVTGEQTKLGKKPGRDVDLGKLTYPGLLGIDDSRQKAEQLVQDACRAVEVFGDRSVWLKDLARFIVERDH